MSASCCANYCAAWISWSFLKTTCTHWFVCIRRFHRGKLAGRTSPELPNNQRSESMNGPNAGLTEILIPAGYVTTVYDPVFKLSSDGMRYLTVSADEPTTIPQPGLPFSLVFRAEPGKEDLLLNIASAYEAASKRRIPPPAFGPLAE